ncbi:hypothetical protein GCM10009853_068090 [Glycomyces scopariae]
MTNDGVEIQGRTGVLKAAPYRTVLQGESQETLIFRTHAYAVFGRTAEKTDYSDDDRGAERP